MGLSLNQSLSMLTSSRRHTLTAPPTVVAAATAASGLGPQAHSPQHSQHPRSRRLVSWQLAHGCLHGHLLAGEESFRVEWDKEDDSVW